MADYILGRKPEEWVPMSPLMGPPLPKWMDITWPWYKEVAPPPVPVPPPSPGLASLYGLVTDAPTRQPIAGVRVFLDWAQAISNQDGYYFFVDVQPGEYTLRAEKEGYETWQA